MFSDTLFEAVCDIEAYEEEMADVYGEYGDHIAIVKAVMYSLQEVLDRPPTLNMPNPADGLTEEERERWQVTCEANIARWIACLQLLGPVTADELIPQLLDRIERQDVMLTRRQERNAWIIKNGLGDNETA